MAAPPEQAVQELHERMDRLKAELQAAVDHSLVIVLRDPRQRGAVGQLWEALLGGLVAHLRQRSRETGQNLLAWVSFGGIMGRKG